MTGHRSWNVFPGGLTCIDKLTLEIRHANGLARGWPALGLPCRAYEWGEMGAALRMNSAALTEMAEVVAVH